jgi:hypothetical protein
MDKVKKLLGHGIYRIGVISLSKIFSAFLAGFLISCFPVPGLPWGDAKKSIILDSCRLDKRKAPQVHDVCKVGFMPSALVPGFGIRSPVLGANAWGHGRLDERERRDQGRGRLVPPWMTASLSTELVGAQEPWTPGARGREQDRLKGSGPGRTFPERRAPESRRKIPRRYR